MSNKCEICGKGSMTGHSVSHSNIKTNRVTKPNLQRVKAVVNGEAVRVRVCTRCIRSGAVDKRSR
ncbi:MAG: 50S ribosomal protein L28 [Myxococcota bacterium]|jgi:large subunit ribosomal protein L28|nr:50S ribosomal protein L28 [Myxococcota bacterium]